MAWNPDDSSALASDAGSNAVASVFLRFSIRRMRLSQKEIGICVGRLSEDQLQYRAADHENSIVNLLRHLAGSLRQWLLHKIDGQTDLRVRDSEFESLAHFSSEEAIAEFNRTVEDCIRLLEGYPHGSILERVEAPAGTNWPAMTALEVIYQMVGHLQQHTGQIILLTKSMLGTDLDLTVPRRR